MRLDILNLSITVCYGLTLSCSCSVNLSQLKEEEVHDLVLTVSSAPGGDVEGSEVRREYYRGTINCLLQICSTNVEEESEAKPINMKAVTRRYVSTCMYGCVCVFTHTPVSV